MSGILAAFDPPTINGRSIAKLEPPTFVGWAIAASGAARIAGATLAYASVCLTDPLVILAP